MKIFDCKPDRSTSDQSFISNDTNNYDKISDICSIQEFLKDDNCHDENYINNEQQTKIFKDHVKLESRFTNNQRKRKNPFIIDEAQVENDEDDDEYDEQSNSKLNSTMSDMMADDQETNHDSSIYLKSTKDIIGIPQNAKYKLKFDYCTNQNVYSQPVIEIDEEDEYEMDSFCNDEIVYASDKDEDEEISFDNKFDSRKIRSTIAKATTSTPINPGKKRRRVIIKSPEI